MLTAVNAGCGWATTPMYSFGRYDAGQEQMFGRLTQTLTARGYQVQSSDAARGTLVVPASYVHRGSRSTFTIQCYRDGWVSMRMSGGWVRLNGNDAKVPKALKTEYDTLVLAIAQGLGPTIGAPES